MPVSNQTRKGKTEMKKHFVTFYSPGTFVAEYSEKPIESWNVQKAVKMARKIVERHGATPYGFRFSTRERTEDELDSKVTKTSGMYYLGGKILTLDDVKARKDPKDAILISNMEGNGIKKIIENCNSWKWTDAFHKEDKLLKFEVERVKE